MTYPYLKVGVRITAFLHPGIYIDIFEDEQALISNMETFEREGCKLKFSDGALTVYQLKRKGLKASRCAFTKENSDVTLKIGQSLTYKAHKQLLKECVPYFKGMFSENFQEAELSSINLNEDIEAQAVLKLMGFIYKGTFEVNISEVQGVFHLADQWGMTGLKEICSFFMTRELEASNCLDLLQLAETYCCESLSSACYQLLAQQYPAISFSNAFLEMPSQLLISTLRLRDLNPGPTGEDFLLDSVFRWMQHDPMSRRASMPEVTRHIDKSAVSSDMRNKWAKEMSSLDEQESCEVSLERRHRQYFIVFCGYLQSRTGPSSPRTPTVEKFDPDLKTFQPLQKLPECPSYGIAFNLFGKILFLSVTVGTDPKSDRRVDSMMVWTYSPLLDWWKALPEFFSAAAHDFLTSCLVNDGAIAHCPSTNKIYAVMVNEGVCINVSCADGDLHCDVACQLPGLTSHLEENHSGFQAVCHRGRLYVMGGFYGPLLERVCSNAVFCLSEDGGRWERRANMMIPRTNCSAAAHGDHIYVTGGYGGTENRRRQQTCEVYDVSNDRWRWYRSLKQSRSHHCTVAANNRLYTIGGKSYASQKLMGGWHMGGARIVSDFVESIEPDDPGGEWERLARMTKSRCHFSALVV
ncbi:kelch-like protein 12 isoform x2 [Plakobranchus ocellatus]|uniref:Kelch-like protein 12 isoform x2 n=1 Tax=Plakobranchus ocellatus TaxID=259542 RepID=A0AAV4B8N5_9GAST|nr:kelch-like protein 12 isoform x2 [Plakobranchus ocellatus]